MKCVLGKVVNGWLIGNCGDYKIINLRSCPIDHLCYFLIRPGLNGNWVVEDVLSIKTIARGSL